MVTALGGHSRHIRKQAFIPLSPQLLTPMFIGADILEEYGAVIGFRQKCLLFGINNKTVRRKFVNDEAARLGEVTVTPNRTLAGYRGKYWKITDER
jgi:hypothetical protein